MIPISQLTDQEKLNIALELKDTASFHVKFYKLLLEFDSQRECFEYLNEIYFEFYGVDKYSSFQSFRNCMYRDAKKYLQNKNKK